MIAFVICLAVLVASLVGMYFAFVRPLRNEVASLGRVFSAHELRSKELHRRAKADIARLRKLSGEEAEAISERLDKLETEDTALCKVN
jgi:hypothetical protein